MGFYLHLLIEKRLSWNRFVHPMRIELISSEPETDILSIELRVQIKPCK